jgi:probable phosphoglycerate mutase
VRAAEVLAPLRPSVVLSSDLSRARDTARETADRAGLPLRLDPRLRELDLGAWQGLTSAQARDRFPDEHAAWRQGRDVARGGGETYQQAGERARACLEEALPEVPPGGLLLAVTHGGTARAATAALLELDPDSAWRLTALGNTCWTVLVQGERGWRLERHNTGLGPHGGAPSGPVGDGAASPDA